LDRTAEPVVVAPSRCPFCRSPAVTATGQKITVATYWRCEACGQVWNPLRLRPSNSFDSPRR
jgi:ribosomal protein L37AE/L43A